MVRNYRPLLIIFLTFAALLSASQLTFLTGQNAYFHDSIVVSNKLFLFYDAWFRGEIPLWSFASNAGQPIWPMLEMGPVLDPVSLVIWWISFHLKASSATAMAWTYCGWWTIFCLGGALCSFRLVPQWRVSLLVFTVLFTGPVSPALGLQAHGFLLPFIYTPLTLFAFLLFADSPSLNRAAHLGLVLGFALSGYQFPYPLLFLLLFLVVFLKEDSHARERIFREWKLGLLAILFAIVLLMPSLAAAIECEKSLLVGRMGMPWFPTVEMILKGTVDFMHRRSATHGHGYVGVVTLLLSLGVGARYFWNRSSFLPLEKTWIAVTAVTFVFCIESRYLLSNRGMGTFLFMRNWGFLLTLAFLGLAQWVSIAYRQFGLGKFQNWLLVIALLDGIVFARSAARQYHEIYPYAKDSIATAPRLNQPTSSPFAKREWLYDSLRHFPYSFEAAAAFHENSAVTATFVPRNEEGLAAYATHWLEAERYRRLLDANIKLSTFRQIFAVDAPLARLVHHYVASSNLFETVDRIRELGFDTTVIEGTANSANLKISPRENVAPLRNTGNSVSFSTQVQSPAIFVYADNYSPDWTVSVDGKTKELLIANGTSKAVALPPGTHEVTFRYHPEFYLTTFYLRAFLLSAYALACVFELSNLSTVFSTRKKRRISALT